MQNKNNLYLSKDQLFNSLDEKSFELRYDQLEGLNNLSFSNRDVRYSSDISNTSFNWDNSIRFNFRTITPVLQPFIKELYPKLATRVKEYKHQDKALALNNIISNLLLSQLNKKFLSVSRNKNDYLFSKFYGFGYYSSHNIIPLIDSLIDKKYVMQRKGYFINNDIPGKCSRIWFTDKSHNIIETYLFNYFQSISVNSEIIEDKIVLKKYSTPLLLKDKLKRLINYRLPNKLSKSEKFLNEYNEMIGARKIVIPIKSFKTKTFSNSSLDNRVNQINQKHIHNGHNGNTDILKANILLHYKYRIPPLLSKIDENTLCLRLDGYLYRVFNVSFNLGGRFYASYQQLPEENREKILINGNKTKELDYSSLHLFMLYHLSGIDYREDPYLALNKNHELRPLFKKISLICINARTRVDAIEGFNREVYRDLLRKGSKKKFLYELMDEYNLSANKLIEMFIKAHSRIEKYFLSGIGTTLQNKDSTIAGEILRYFFEKDIPVLCIHDSFIIEEQYSEELYGVMREIYKKYLGFYIHVK